MAFCKTIRLVTMVAVSLAALTTTAWAQHKNGGNPTRYESKDRDQWQLPEKIISLLELKEGMVVADIGSSSGYFSRRFSVAVGSSGRALAVDLDTVALGWLAAKARELGLDNLETIRAEADDPHLPAGKVDLIFFCNSLHHISDRVEYLRNLKKYLAPGGRVAIVDFFKKKLPVGPKSLDHKLSWSEVYNALRDAGYRTVREPQGLPYQYFIIARPN